MDWTAAPEAFRWKECAGFDFTLAKPVNGAARLNKMRVAERPPDWVISNLTLPECRSLSAASSDLEKDDVQADPKVESGKVETAG